MLEEQTLSAAWARSRQRGSGWARANGSHTEFITGTGQQGLSGDACGTMTSEGKGNPLPVTQPVVSRVTQIWC